MKFMGNSQIKTWSLMYRDLTEKEKRIQPLKRLFFWVYLQNKNG